MLPVCNNYFNTTPNNNRNTRDSGLPPSRKRFLFGIFILFIVDVLWVVSSEITKYIYWDLKLERPFLVTYLRSSLLLVYLIILLFSPPSKDPCQPSDYTHLVENTAETDDENYFNDSSTNNSLGDSTFVPVRAGETTDSDDAVPRAVRFNKVAEVRVMSASQAGEALLARLSWSASMRASMDAHRRAAAAATKRHLRLALIIFLPYFISNYLYRVSLLHAPTSVATILLSSCNAFALTLGAIFAQTPADRLTLVNIISIVLGTGSLLIATTLCRNTDWIGVMGATGAALVYSFQLIMFRQEVRNSDGINAPLLIGLVGCACCLGAGLISAGLSASGVERMEVPPSHLWKWLFIDALLGPVVFDALWIWGTSLSSPVAGRVSLLLCAPASLCADIWRNNGGGAAIGAAVLTALSALTAHSGGDILQRIQSNIHNRERGASLRSVQDLDEQSEALINDEPT